MHRESIDQAVREVVSAVLHRELGATEDLVRGEEPAWDSLKHIEIMFALEDRCDVRFSQDELASLDRLSAIVERVKGHIGPSTPA
jgi:acyl carrier protein